MLIGRGQSGHQSQHQSGFYYRAAPDPTGGPHQIVQCTPEMQADKLSWPRLGITCMPGLAMLIPARLDLSKNSRQVGPLPKFPPGWTKLPPGSTSPKIWRSCPRNSFKGAFTNIATNYPKNICRGRGFKIFDKYLLCYLRSRPNRRAVGWINCCKNYGNSK